MEDFYGSIFMDLFYRIYFMDLLYRARIEEYAKKNLFILRERGKRQIYNFIILNIIALTDQKYQSNIILGIVRALNLRSVDFCTVEKTDEPILLLASIFKSSSNRSFSTNYETDISITRQQKKLHCVLQIDFARITIIILVYEHTKLS